jgi:hypothetical protein
LDIRNLYIIRLEIEKLKLLLLDEEEIMLFNYIDIYEYKNMVI